MAAYFKRRIASKIVGLVKSNYISDSQLKDLEQRLFNLVKVQPLRQGATIEPSLRLNAEDLRRAVHTEQGSIAGLQDWLQTIGPSDGNHHFQVDRNTFLQTVLKAVRSERDNYGYIDSCIDKQRVCVEFSSPNVAKPFHVGHLRSTIIGNVIANLYEAAGHNVKRLNFLGDWGTQFGLLTLGLRKYCHDKNLTTDPMLEILKAYVQINKDVEKESGSSNVMSSMTYQEGMDLFSRLERGDPELTAVWSQLRNLTVSELDKVYKRLGVEFTHIQYESDYRQKTGEILERLGQAKLLEYGEDGVGFVSVKNKAEMTRASVVKSDGSSLYLTRDIAAAIDRQNHFSPDRMHYVVEMGQRGHFTNLAAILKRLDVPWAHRPVDDIHIRFGRVKGMSTRKGQSVHLREVLDEAGARVFKSLQDKESTRVEENVEEVSSRLAVSSIILQDLKSHRAKDYTFSWKNVLNFKADSGVFVQYCHARICSMMTNCGVPLSDDVDVDVVMKDAPLVKLVLHLARYPDVFNNSLEKLEPHHVVQYLFQLCHQVNAAYATCPVKGEPLDVAQARLLVFDCSRQVIANCLQVLGISPLLKM